jgi:alpha-beta hydrolase superfamily lysophospholipase
MNDKLNITDQMTARMGVNTVGAMDRLMAHEALTDRDSAFCKMPVLILQGTQDKVTSLPVARTFYQRITNFDKQMIEYDGLYHCLFNEPEREKVLEDSTSWLVSRARQANAFAAAQRDAKPVVQVPPVAKL